MQVKNAICVIPAKARSTRFPGKNLALLAGKPLVVWAIDVARAAGVFDVVMVSTDDDEITRISKSAGAEVPFRRSELLSKDTVEVPAVVKDALEWFRCQRQEAFDAVCTLQVTSPLRTVTDIVASKRLLDSDPQVEAVVSVCRYHHHPHWALRIEEQRILPEYPLSASQSRQHLPDLYHPDGTVDWQRARSVLQGKGIYDGLVLPYRTPPESALDIDYPQDLDYAAWRLTQQPL